MGIGRFYQPEAQTFAPAPIPVDIRSIGILEQDRRDRYDKTFDDLAGLGEEYDAKGQPIFGNVIKQSEEAVSVYDEAVDRYRNRTSDAVDEFLQTNDVQEAKKRIKALKTEREHLLDPNTGIVGALNRQYNTKATYDAALEENKTLPSDIKRYLREEPTANYVENVQNSNDPTKVVYNKQDIQEYVDPTNALMVGMDNWEEDSTTFNYTKDLYKHYGVIATVDEPEVFAGALTMAFNDQSVANSISLDAQAVVWNALRNEDGRAIARLNEAVNKLENDQEFANIAREQGVNTDFEELKNNPEELEGLMRTYIAVSSAEQAAKKNSYKRVKQYNTQLDQVAYAKDKAAKAARKEEEAKLAADRLGFGNTYKTAISEKNQESIETLKEIAEDGSGSWWSKGVDYVKGFFKAKVKGAVLPIESIITGITNTDIDEDKQKKLDKLEGSSEYKKADEAEKRRMVLETMKGTNYFERLSENSKEFYKNNTYSSKNITNPDEYKIEDETKANTAIKKIQKNGTESQKQAAEDLAQWLEAVDPQGNLSYKQAVKGYEDFHINGIQDTYAIMTGDEKEHLTNLILGNPDEIDKEENLTEYGYAGSLLDGSWIDHNGYTEPISVEESGNWRVKGDQVWKTVRDENGNSLGKFMGVALVKNQDTEEEETRIWMPNLQRVKKAASIHPYTQPTKYIPNEVNDTQWKNIKENGLTSENIKKYGKYITAGLDGNGKQIAMLTKGKVDPESGNWVEDRIYLDVRKDKNGNVVKLAPKFVGESGESRRYGDAEAIYDSKRNFMGVQNFSAYDKEDPMGNQSDNVTGKTTTSESESYSSTRKIF